jgi:hypothetical protein
VALARYGQPKFPDSTATLISGIPAAEREFMVYLPLRNGVTSLEFGLPKGTTIKPGPTRATRSKPIVFYGTSITHGIGASRARMTHVAMLGRIFNREVVKSTEIPGRGTSCSQQECHGIPSGRPAVSRSEKSGSTVPLEGGRCTL